VTYLSPLSPRLNLVIDTNILLLLIGYECSRLDKQGALERSRVLNDIRGRDRVSPDRFDGLWRVFETAAKRVVTQHVVAEAYGLRKRLASSYRKDVVWQGALTILRHPGIEEESFQVVDLDADPKYHAVLIALGPSDAGILYTAERRKATILTDDGELQHWASTRNIQWLSLNLIGSE
jgi:rRNA-processing protein FCF1